MSDGPPGQPCPCPNLAGDCDGKHAPPRRGGRPASLPELPEGLTYRQLDYWTRLGYVKTDGAPSPGSGGRRAWPAEELEIAARMVKLRDEGYELRLAAKRARAEQPVWRPAVS